MSEPATTSVLQPPPETRSQGVEAWWPRAPESIADCGLPAEFLEELLLKSLYVHGPGTLEELAQRLGTGYQFTEELTTLVKNDQAIEAMGATGYSDWGIRYRLTGKGTKLAEDALERSRYVGVVPVTLAEYTDFALRQSLRRNPPTQAMLERTFEPFILRPDVKESLARIFFSGRAVLVFGGTGNGKTSIVESYAKTLSNDVLYPHALAVSGQVVRIFDPVRHIPLPVEEPASDTIPGGSLLLRSSKSASRLDRRWIKIRRPVIFVGGELENADLDLTFDARTRLYQAPAHIKAQDGVFVIDDFGRQRARPEEILNRWIVPMASATDNLTLQTGESFTVPFEIALIFSTNLSPRDLADEAFLRRIPYKINLPGPDRALFATITRLWCDRMGVSYREQEIDYLTDKIFNDPEIVPSATHPRDIAQMVLDYARYDGVNPLLTESYIDRACGVYFIKEG
jgi:predicted ATPase with chaperone activity